MRKLIKDENLSEEKYDDEYLIKPEVKKRKRSNSSPKKKLEKKIVLEPEPISSEDENGSLKSFKLFDPVGKTVTKMPVGPLEMTPIIEGLYLQEQEGLERYFAENGPKILSVYSTATNEVVDLCDSD